MTDSIIERLQSIFPELTPEYHAPLGGTTTHSEISHHEVGGQVPSVVNVPIEVDPRVERMVRLALLSAPAVILVGPPGSGKTTLLRQIVDQIVADPKSFGFEAGPKGVEWSAAEETWSTTDLVGGQTIDDGELRFRPGRVLNAIADENWLIVDEVNRADMDRIFGGLMTWLSGQEVTLGPVTTEVGSPQVQLGWSHSTECRVENKELLTNPRPGAVRYLASTEWRLLGTYNALDAHRVFRFGHALGRRFLRVPIPPADEDKFRKALLALESGLREPVLDAITALYSAHLKDSVTMLGPALFLRMADYIAAGTTTDAEPISDGDEVGQMNSSDSVVSPVERELIAEAYLVNVGSWLREMEEHLTALRSALVDEHHALSQSDWEWIMEMSSLLS